MDSNYPDMQKKFEQGLDIFNWIRIAASPFIIGCVVGLICFFTIQDDAGIICAVFIALAGLITGILWANRISRREGTTYFMSRETASEDLDPKRKD